MRHCLGLMRRRAYQFEGYSAQIFVLRCHLVVLQAIRIQSCADSRQLVMDTTYSVSYVLHTCLTMMHIMTNVAQYPYPPRALEPMYVPKTSEKKLKKAPRTQSIQNVPPEQKKRCIGQAMIKKHDTSHPTSSTSTTDEATWFPG